MSVKNRWYITATLTTITPMRIGTGEYETKGEDEDKRTISPCLMAGDKPYIPATTLKGLWRDLLTDEDVNTLFGTAHGDEGLGGKMIVYDSVCTDSPKEISRHQTQIERETRTAKFGSLREIQYLPVGTQFPIQIVIENTIASDIEKLYPVLSGKFNIGGNKTNGFGNFEICEAKIYCLSLEALKESSSKGISFFEAIVKTKPIEVEYTPIVPNELKLTLQFNSPFLVAEKPKNHKDGEPNLVPLRNNEGQYILPASSFRGALRAQAQRIQNTMGHYEESIKRIFGETKQKGRVQFQDFVTDAKETKTYDFVAIDRFTGGGKDGAKFKIEVLEEAKFTGGLRLGDLCKDDIKLLGLLLRDLNEGDITLGYGATKGFGMCEIKDYYKIMNDLKTIWENKND